MTDTLPADFSFIVDEAICAGVTTRRCRGRPIRCFAISTSIARRSLAAAPFCVLATQGPDGADVSPRGDPPGFLSVIDDTHVLLPDRVGNNRLDNMANILANPRVGLLVLVPGMNETLRINGTARITDDARLLEPCAVQGRAPKVGILVHVEEAFLHCAKALVRSKLWDAAAQVDRAQFASYPGDAPRSCRGADGGRERAPVPDHGRAGALLMGLAVSIIAYDGIEPIDIGATYGVLSMARRIAPEISMHVAAPARDVVMAQGLRLTADHSLDDAPRADVVLVLGGPGWVNASQDPVILDHVRGAHAGGAIVASVCTGAMILAAAGLLDNRRATTKREIVAGEERPLDLLGRRGAIDAVEARIVDEGDIITGGGVSLGHDLTLYLIQRFVGVAAARETARILEYERAYAAKGAGMADIGV